MVLTFKEGVWTRQAQQFGGPRGARSISSKNLGDLSVQIIWLVNHLLFHGPPIWVAAAREIVANRSYAHQFRLGGLDARVLLVQRQVDAIWPLRVGASLLRLDGFRGIGSV